MNIDDRNAEYLAGVGGHPSGQSKGLEAARAALDTPNTWSMPPPDMEARVISSISSAASGSVAAGWAGWIPRIAAVAAVTLGFVALMALWPSGPTVDLIGTELIPQATGVATLDPTGAGWAIEMSLTDLPPAAPGTYYEGWVWGDDGKGVSIGTFHLRDSNKKITLWSGVDVNEYPSIWISLQTEGAGNEVSDQIVMRGRLQGPAGQ